jgi:hypothetical protein
VPLTNYTELQASVATWLNRTDLVAAIPDFIALAEAQISRRLRRSTVRASVTISDPVYVLSAAVAELRSLRLVTADTRKDIAIAICTPEILNEHRAVWAAIGRPRYAAVVGSSLLLVPAPDQAYTMEISYFPRLIPLSSSNLTNIVLTEAPDLYLFGSLKEAATYLEHDERVPLWESKFEAALNQLAIVREREEFNASLHPARLPRVF